MLSGVEVDKLPPTKPSWAETASARPVSDPGSSPSPSSSFNDEVELLGLVIVTSADRGRGIFCQNNVGKDSFMYQLVTTT